MNQEERSGTIIGGVALVCLLLIGTFSYVLTSSQTITGAVSGESAPYRWCMSKYGRNTDGSWAWDKIKDCREYYKELENSGDANIPRLYRSMDRSAFQNTGTIER
ncbi:hypothetical protein HZA99_05210 [Candidatus Woesearchaeota archaeon]|nr:hypothetical protein [Candidatus Woesearchaeota archaeon]